MSKRILNDFWDFVEDDISCQLLFTTQKNEEYKSLEPRIDGDLLSKNLMPTIVEYLKGYMKDKEISDYNNEYDSKDEVMAINKNEVEASDKIIESLKNVTEHNFKESFNIKDIKFYVLKLKKTRGKQEDVAYVFKKYRQSSLLTQKKFLKLFNDKEGKLIETKQDMIVLDTFVDVILYKDVIYILNRNPFEQIFNYKDEYIKQRDRVLDLVKQEKRLFFSTIDSFEKFSEYCKDARYQKKFKAIEDNDGIKVLKDNMDRLPELNEKFFFEFELDESNKIICNKKEALADILDLLSGKLVLWALNNEPRETAVTKKRATKR